jgi:hypothetical protein
LVNSAATPTQTLVRFALPLGNVPDSIGDLFATGAECENYGNQREGNGCRDAETAIYGRCARKCIRHASGNASNYRRYDCHKPILSHEPQSSASHEITK